MKEIGPRSGLGGEGGRRTGEVMGEEVGDRETRDHPAQGRAGGEVHKGTPVSHKIGQITDALNNRGESPGNQPIEKSQAPEATRCMGIYVTLLK